MALTPQEKAQLPVPQRRLPPGAAEQLGQVQKPQAALPPGARPTITVDSAGRASAATIRPPTAPPLQATPLPTPQPTGGARTVPIGQDGTQARLDQLKAERAARAGVRATQAVGATAAPLTARAPVGPASTLGAPPPAAGASPLGAPPPAAAAPPAPSAAATTLGAPPAGTPAPGVVSRVADKVRGGGRSLGRAAVPVGVLLESADVARVAQDPNATGIDVATQATEGTGKLASAYAGAKGGAAVGTALGGPVGGVVGGLIGGLGGYFGADKVIDGGRAVLNGGTPTSRRVGNFVDNSPAMKGLGLVFPGGPKVFSALTQVGAAATDAPDSSPAASAPDIAAPAETPAAAASPGADAAPAASSAEVLGQFNGRDITRGDAEKLAGQLQVVGGGNGTGIIPPAAATPAAAQLGANVGNVSSSDRRKLAKQIDATIAGLGDLNMRSKRDLAGQLLGLKGRLVEGKAATDAQLATEQARLDAGAAAAQLGADVQREVAGSRSSGSPIVGEDGNLYVMQGTTLTPVTGADGKPARAPTSNKEAQALYAELVKKLTIGGETPEQIQAIQQQAAQLSGINGAYNQAPAGYTKAGTTPDGRPVYKDAQGNTFTQ